MFRVNPSNYVEFAGTHGLVVTREGVNIIVVTSTLSSNIALVKSNSTGGEFEVKFHSVDEDLQNLAMYDFSYGAQCAHSLSLKGEPGALDLGLQVLSVMDDTWRICCDEQRIEDVQAFYEFNYLLKIDTDLFTYDIQNFKTYDEYEREFNNDKARGTEEPWSENEVPYKLCDHTSEPYHFKSGETKWPTCTYDIDGFCNGGKLPGMVRIGSITYFQDHRWYDKLADRKLKDEALALKAKIIGSWGDATHGVNAHEIAPFTRMENFGREPYANMKTEWASNPYLDVNRIFGRDYEASNEIRDDEYSFDDDEEYITIKESEYLNHSKDSLDAYQELLHLIDEGWVEPYGDLAETMIWYILKRTCVELIRAF
ncbi:hypothetical protein Tco_0348398 [Tanacetum coccineum]